MNKMAQNTQRKPKTDDKVQIVNTLLGINGSMKEFSLVKILKWDSTKRLKAKLEGSMEWAKHRSSLTQRTLHLGKVIMMQ